MKKYKLIIAALMASSFYTVAEEPYYELHDPDVANSAYTEFKEGTGKDPFYFLDRGYKGRYSNDIVNFVLGEKEQLISDFLADKTNDLFLTTESLKKSEGDYLLEIYESHINEDGSFDAESYAESYQTYLDGKRLDRLESMDGRYQSVMSTISQGMDLQKTYRDGLNSDVSSAQENLLTVMNADKQERKNVLSDIHASSAERLSMLANQAGATITLANEYADCGGACVFPDPPIESLTPPPPPPPSTPLPPTLPYCEGVDLVYYIDGVWIFHDCP